ncbi:hypothetical protein D3C73_1074590 [compost metagenome]
MRIPGAAGHQQYRLMLQFAQGIGDVQGVGHDHQARLQAQFRNHRGSRAATVYDDACMFANPRDGSPSNRLLIFGDGLA